MAAKVTVQTTGDKNSLGQNINPKTCFYNMGDDAWKTPNKAEIVKIYLREENTLHIM